MNEVYVIAGGEWLRNNLNAIAAFMGTRTWDSIEKIALTLSVLAVAVMWVQRHNVMDLLGWVAVFVLISLLVNVRTSVQIIDNSDLVKVHRVDNVPVGLAMPLSLTTRIGHAMVASYEMIFTQPDSVTYSKTGMLFGAELVSKSTDFLSRNPEIANLFQDYVQRHGNQLDIFDLGAGIQGATIGIPGGLPLPDARLCGIGSKSQLIKELIHVAVHIR